MPETCENRCENCVYVERGYDEYSHDVHSVGNNCPIYDNLKLYRKVTGRTVSIEMITGWIGCNHFRLDEGYKQKCEETEKFIAGMNKQWDEARAKNDNKSND